MAAAVHDIDHPGLNNGYHVNAASPLAVTYSDSSVLERHHLAVAFRLLQRPECNIVEYMTRPQLAAFRKIVIDMVMATDLRCVCV